VVYGRRGQPLTAIATQLCKTFAWTRANGELATVSCLSMLRRLEKHGMLKLPAARAPRSAKPWQLPESLATDEACVRAFAPMVDLDHALCLRLITPQERDAFRALLVRHHYLGCGRPVGEWLGYAAFYRGELVALLSWASAALHNQPRDAHVGWDAAHKERHLHLVADNVRYLILPWVRIPHLASQILGANLRRLSRDFERAFGHRVLMAETFVDGARFKGTCYRASNWIHVGRTSGWAKKGRAYEQHNHPKDVFVYPLHKRANALLDGSEEMPTKQPRKPPVLDVKVLPMAGHGGLLEALSHITDPRKAKGKRHSLISILAIAALATMSGAKGYLAIAQWAETLDWETLKRLGHPGRRPPGESTIRRTLNKVDASELDRVARTWLTRQVAVRGQAIAIDGKTVRGSRDGDEGGVHLLGAVLAARGVVVGQHEVLKSTNEAKTVNQLLDPMDIHGAVVTGDAAFTQTELARYLVEEKKADYVFRVKANQPGLLQDIKDLDFEVFSPHNTDQQGPRSTGDAADLGEQRA
jgi:hypothetical protein